MGVEATTTPQFIKRHGVMENIVSIEKIEKQGYIMLSTPAP